MAWALNFRIPANTTLTIGGVNFSSHLAGFSLSRPLPEIGTPQVWTGTISLTTPAIPSLVAETLDPATNPNSRWEKGCYQIILAIGGSRMCPPLYVLRYSYQEPNGGQPARAELQVGDDLALRSDYQPAQDYQSLAFDPTESPTVAAIVQRALSSVGLSNYSLGVTGTVPVAPGKPEGSFVGFAQKYLGERGRWLYLHTDGQVRDVVWPAVDDAAILAYPRSGVEIWEPIDSDVPKEVYRVNGSCEKFVPNSAPVGTVIEKEYDDLPGVGTVLVKTTTTEILADTPFYFRRRVTVDTALHALNPQVFEGNLTTSRTVTEEEHTADAFGQVIQITTTASAPLALYLPDLAEELAGGTSAGALLPYYIGQIGNIERSVESFTAGLNNVMSKRQKVIYRPVRFGATGYAVTSVERESESWAGNTAGFSLDGNDPPSGYYTRSFQRSLRAASVQKDDGSYLMRPLSVKESRVEPGVSPPSFNTLRPSAETGQVAVTGEATFLPASVSPFYQQTEQLSSETLSTTAECNALATVVGRLAHESYRGRKFNAPIPAEWLSNPAPFRVAAIHDGVFVLTNDTLTLSSDGLEVCWQGYRLGYLTTPVPETGSWTPEEPTPPITPRTTVTRTGQTPIIRLTVPTGDWQQGGTVERTGTTPVITMSVGTGTYSLTKSRTGTTPVISLTVGTGTWEIVGSDLISQVWSERYMSGKVYVYTNTTTVTTRSDSPVTGEFSSEITYTNCDYSTGTHTATMGGVWVQADAEGNPTSPYNDGNCP